MANTQYVFLMRSSVPERRALQASIDALGLDLKLDPEYTPFTDSGFSPCILFGRPNVGFEVGYAPVSALGDLAAIAGPNDFCISMTWGGSMQDCACASIVGYALARDFGALVSYEGNPPDSLEQLHIQMQDVIKYAQAPDIALPPPAQVAKPWWKLW